MARCIRAPSCLKNVLCLTTKSIEGAGAVWMTPCVRGVAMRVVRETASVVLLLMVVACVCCAPRGAVETAKNDKPSASTVESFSFGAKCMEGVGEDLSQVPEVFEATDGGAGLVSVTHSGVVGSCCARFWATGTVDARSSTALIQYEEAESDEPCDCRCALEFNYALGRFDGGDWTLKAGQSSTTVDVEGL